MLSSSTPVFHLVKWLHAMDSYSHNLCFPFLPLSRLSPLSLLLELQLGRHSALNRLCPFIAIFAQGRVFSWYPFSLSLFWLWGSFLSTSKHTNNDCCPRFLFYPSKVYGHHDRMWVCIAVWPASSLNKHALFSLVYLNSFKRKKNYFNSIC